MTLWSHCRSWSSVSPSNTCWEKRHLFHLLAFKQSVTSADSRSVSLFSFEGQQDWAGARIMVRADHQHQWCHAVRRRHVHLLPLHHACQNSQSLPDCPWWVHDKQKLKRLLKGNISLCVYCLITLIHSVHLIYHSNTNNNNKNCKTSLTWAFLVASVPCGLHRLLFMWKRNILIF